MASKKDNSFQNLLKRLQIEPNLPASRQEISDFEKETRLKLPPNVRAIYSVSNGVVLRKNLLTLCSLKDSRAWLRSFDEFGIPNSFGYFPLIDDHESNPFCVCCAKPMTRMVVRVFHDDQPQLVFRSVESLFDWILTLPSDAINTEQAGDFGDFVGSQRVMSDLAVAKKLQSLSASLSDGAQVDAERFAVTLLSEAAIDAIIEQLESNSRDVRDKAYERLFNMNNVKARSALLDYEQKLLAFGTQCVDALEKAGIESILEQGCVAAMVGKWQKAVMDLQFFYDRRNNTDVWEFLVERTKKALRIE